MAENFYTRGAKVTNEEPINISNFFETPAKKASVGFNVDGITQSLSDIPRIYFNDATPATSEFAAAPDGSLMLVMGAVPYYKKPTDGWTALA